MKSECFKACFTTTFLTDLAILQRVKSAAVTVDGQLISTIGKGILVFAAIGKDDTIKEVESMASKVLKVKLWDDEKGSKWKCNVQEIDGEVLCGSYYGELRDDLCKSRCLSSFSLAIHASSLYEERQQTGLPQVRTSKSGQRLVRQVLREGPGHLSSGSCKGRRLPSDDGR